MISLWTALTLGFLGSLHCLGMCGPLVMSVPIYSEKKGSTLLNFSSYHLSRILAYSFLGVIPGIVGAGLHMTAAQQWISIVIGILFLFGCLMSLNGYLNIHIPFVSSISGRIQNLFFSFMKSQNKGKLVSLGFLNGLIPCGMVYMAMAAALIETSLWHSMLFMAVFGLGTLPMFALLALVQTSNTLKLRGYLKRLIPVSLGIMGIIFLWRGICVAVPMDLSILKEMGWNVMCH